MRSGPRCVHLAVALLALLLGGMAVAAPADPGLAALLARYKAEPDDALLCEQIGVAYVSTGDLAAAAKFFTSAVRLDPQRLPARKNLATVLWFLGRRQECEALFLTVEKRAPSDPVPQLYLGLNDYQHKDYEKAAAHFLRAGELASSNPEILPIIVETYLSTARFVAARGALEQALAHAPGSARLRFELGLTYALDGNFEPGRQAFLNASASDPAWPLPVIALGIVDLQTGHAPEAAAWFQKAQMLAPRDYRCYYFRAVALKHSQAGGEDATRTEQLRDLRRAVEIDPGQEKVWAALGEAEIAYGRDAEGEADLQHALRLAPYNPGALYKLALLYRRQGKISQSARLLHLFQESKEKSQGAENELVLLLRTAKQ